MTPEELKSTTLKGLDALRRQVQEGRLIPDGFTVENEFQDAPIRPDEDPDVVAASMYQRKQVYTGSKYTFSFKVPTGEEAG